MFFCLGPGTALGHSSIIFMIECQVNYIMDCIRTLSKARNGEARVIEVRSDVLDNYLLWLKSNLDKTVFHAGLCIILSKQVWICLGHVAQKYD